VVRGVDLPQSLTPVVAQSEIGDRCDRPEEGPTVIQQSGLLRDRDRLLEYPRAAGKVEGIRDVPGELAIRGQILECRLEIADVRLILDDRNAGYRIEDPVSRFADAAIRRDRAVAGTLPVDRLAGVVKVEITRNEVVLDDVRLLMVVEQSGDPIHVLATLG